MRTNSTFYTYDKNYDAGTTNSQFESSSLKTFKIRLGFLESLKFSLHQTGTILLDADKMLYFYWTPLLYDSASIM